MAMPMKQQMMTTPKNTDTATNLSTPPPQCIDFDALKARIRASLIQDQTNLWKKQQMTMTMLTKQQMTTMPENTDMATNLSTPPPQRINFDALKARIRASLIQDQTNLRKMQQTTTTMPMTQLMTTTENTDMTANMLRRNPPAIASTAKEPQPQMNLLPTSQTMKPTTF